MTSDLGTGLRVHTPQSSLPNADFSGYLSLYPCLNLPLYVSISPFCVYLTEYDRVSAGPLPFLRTKIDRQPGNLPSPRGLQHWQLAPPGPHLMSHTVDTFATFPHAHHVLLFALFNFSWQRPFVGNPDVSTAVGIMSTWVHPTCTVYFSPLWEMLFLYLSGHVQCHNTGMSTARVVWNGIVEARNLSPGLEICSCHTHCTLHTVPIAIRINKNVLATDCS